MTAAAPAAGPGPWCVRWTSAPGARLRLFCLPHTGGGAATYRPWAHLLAPDIEVVAIRLPGREARFNEPALRHIDDIVSALVAELGPWLDRPHAWFGHSLGAMIAFETCRALRRLRLAEPARLLVSGRPAPHLPSRQPPMGDLPLPEFVARLGLLNGTPTEMLDPGVLAALLPTLRADSAVVESYPYRTEPPLNCPISAFGGIDDPLVTGAELAAWREHGGGPGGVHLFPGGHFYLREQRTAVLAAIRADLGVPPEGSEATVAGPRRSGASPAGRTPYGPAPGPPGPRPHP